MSREKELAYRYDLFITPDWRERFDLLINENFEMPVEGYILDVNCGTGSHAIELAEKMSGKGEVTGLDPSDERLEIARAKAQVKKVEDVRFRKGIASDIPFGEEQFDLVLGDASMLPAAEIEEVLSEMVRVTRPGGRVILKMTTRGSFDEFFSIYWEALFGVGIAEEVWSDLRALIEERRSVSDVELMAERAGLNEIQTLSSKEEFLYDTGTDFVESPLIKDGFWEEWLSIVPDEYRQQVSDNIVSTIERERHNAPFDISIKATVVSGIK